MSVGLDCDGHGCQQCMALMSCQPGWHKHLCSMVQKKCEKSSLLTK